MKSDIQMGMDREGTLVDTSEVGFGPPAINLRELALS